MENRNSSIASGNNLIEELQNLSSKIESLYPKIFEDNFISEELFVKLFNYLNEIINFLNKHSNSNKYFNGLCEIYKEKKLNLCKLRTINELSEYEKIKKPPQTSNETIINIIKNCINYCDNFNKNNITVTKIDDGGKPTRSQMKQIQSEGPAVLDFKRLEELYKELLICDEISDQLYENINDKIKLQEIYERINDENEKFK